MNPKPNLKVVPDRTFLRTCTVCRRKIPTNIVEEEYVCCDCRKEIKELNKKIDKLPMCEERDNLIKQMETLKWIKEEKP